jgi:hypothetical protein
MKANEIKIGRKRARAPSIAALSISVASPLYGKFDDQNGILGEQPDKHDQSDLEVDIVSNPEIDKTNSSSDTNR